MTVNSFINRLERTFEQIEKLKESLDSSEQLIISLRSDVLDELHIANKIIDSAFVENDIKSLKYMKLKIDDLSEQNKNDRIFDIFRELLGNNPEIEDRLDQLSNQLSSKIRNLEDPTA